MPKRPADPSLVVALDNRAGVEGPPAVDDAVVAPALDEKRPKITVLLMAIRSVAAGAAEDRPDEILIHEIGVLLA